MEIVNFSITPKTAVANGADIISASAVIMNGNDYVSNESVVFSITSGSAIFSNGLSSIVVSSNSLGAVSASLVDTTAETVVVEIALQSNAAIHDTLTATFTQSDNTADTINLLLVVDDARADGEDQNQVELQTFSGAIPVASTDVSVALTNGAVFINGDKAAKIKTDSKGRASLPFTSTTAGESKLTAYLSDNIAVYNSVTATFVSASPEVGLVLDVVSDNAQANGNAVNRVRATVTDSDTHKPLSGQAVTFTVTSGSAVFDNDSISYSATTDSNGEAYASVKDNTVETVTLSAVGGDKTATATIHFSKDYAPLKIQRVYNTNKNFEIGHPVTAWTGAELTFEATGGSGEYTWNVNYPEELHPENTLAKSVNMSFTDRTTINRQYIIEVTDNVTGGTDSYRFSLSVFFERFGIYEFYSVLSPSDYPSENDLISLYNDWGNMGSYTGWLDKGRSLYWTNHIILLQTLAVNMRNGNSTWAGHLTEQYYAKRKK